MPKYTQTYFDNLIKDEVASFLLTFEKAFESNEFPTFFAKEELSSNESKKANHFNSDQTLNKMFHDVNALKTANKYLTHTQIISAYCKQHKVPVEPLFLYIAKLKAIDQISKFLIRKISPSKAESNNDSTVVNDSIDVNIKSNLTQSDENSKSEIVEGKNDSHIFSVARKVLFLFYLTDAASEKEESVKDVDRTEIARLLRALISENNDSDRSIHGTYIYDKVKELFARPDQASKKDLLFLKEIFQNLGLLKIVEEIKIDLTLIK